MASDEGDSMTDTSANMSPVQAFQARRLAEARKGWKEPTGVGLDQPGASLLRSALTTSAALAAVGRTLAAIEDDCSKSWPECPRQSILCDCRLRAVRATNALRYFFDPT